MNTIAGPPITMAMLTDGIATSPLEDQADQCRDAQDRDGQSPFNAGSTSSTAPATSD